MATALKGKGAQVINVENKIVYLCLQEFIAVIPSLHAFRRTSSKGQQRRKSAFADLVL